MLPWGSLAEGLALRACTLQQVLMTTYSVTSKHSFHTQEDCVLCKMGENVQVFICMKNPLHAFCGGKWWGKQTASHHLPSKNIHFICHHPLCMKCVWMQVLSYRFGGSCGPSKPPVLPATAVLCAWPLKRPGCLVLTTAENAQKVSLRNKWNGYLFAKQKQRGKRCNSPVYTHTHTHLQCVNVSKVQFKGTCDLCCKMNACSQPRRLSKPEQVTDLYAIALTDKPTV